MEKLSPVVHWKPKHLSFRAGRYGFTLLTNTVQREIFTANSHWRILFHHALGLVGAGLRPALR